MPIKIDLINPLFQSPYSYLQAAGSEGTDGSAPGIHLRWDFLRQLGSEHLAKGKLSGSAGPYPSTSGFNKNNDYINIYRVAYKKEFVVTLDFSSAPKSIKDSGDKKIWFYTGFTPVTFDPSNLTDVQVRFKDANEYDAIRLTIDPSVNPLAFIQSYSGVIEVETINKLMFKGFFELGIVDPSDEEFAYFDSDAVSMIHDSFDASSDLDKYFVSCRKRLKRLDSSEKRSFICENIAYFRFKSKNLFVKRLVLSTYQDHVIGENGEKEASGSFELIDKFSIHDGLSDSDALVFTRLEDTSKYLIDKRWPKFNNTNLSTGEFTVKVQNYKDKWLDAEGLKPAVITYLDLSKTDPKAVTYLPSEDPDDQAMSEVSYLDMLKMVSLDFHAARMLGLGHIDLSKGTMPGVKDGGVATSTVINYINNPFNSSSSVRTYLLGKKPNSDAVLIAAINRIIPLDGAHLRDILMATSLLSDAVLIAMLNRTIPLSAVRIQEILIANSPLSDTVMQAVINKYLIVPPANLEAVLAVNAPLSEEILLALVNRTIPLPFDSMQRIMIANSPLSDKVLTALLNRPLPILPANVLAIFLKNTPISPAVESVLRSKSWISMSIIDEIQRSKFVAGRYNPSQFIYVMEYVTEVALEKVVPVQVTTHLFMSLPTSRKDYRLPPAPVLQDISYGLFIDNKTVNPTQITDDEGYTPFADERFVNLKREPFQFESPFDEFFESKREYCICDQSLPIGYGIEYKLDTETDFRKPEINHDISFFDPSGLPETIFVPDTGNEMVFNHQEKQEGIHEYALYSVNWFSRVSPISNKQTTDYTKFPKRNTLLPPFNFAVQLIQQEEPLIFTTQSEQDRLTILPEPDKTLVRATFDWNYNHIKAYEFGDYAEFFFRPNPPLGTKGKITSVNQLSDNQIEVETGVFFIASTNTPQFIQPKIHPDDVNRFIGSLFTANKKTFIVRQVISSGIGENPKFILDQIRDTSSTDLNNDNIFTVTEQFISPQEGAVFMVVENLSEASNWDLALNEKVYLEPFHTLKTIKVVGAGTVANNGTYTVDNVQLSGSTTKIKVKENIASSAGVPGNIIFPKRVKVISASSGIFTVEGNVSTQLTVGTIVTINASNGLDGQFTVLSVATSGTNTNVAVLEPFVAIHQSFYLSFNRTIAATSLNPGTKTITVAGDLTEEIIPVHNEIITHSDGTQQTINVGGIYSGATIIEFEDKDSSGNEIPGSRTGVYEITFDNFQLSDHIQENVEWYKGIVRILEDSSFLPTSLEPDRTIPEQKVLQVWNIDRSGGTLKLLVFDSSFQADSAYNPIDSYVPILSGTGKWVNFHPSYRTYLFADTNGSVHFDAETILPSVGEGSRQSFMAVRSVDINESPELTSYIATPVVLLAQEISEPLAPGIPKGPAYATRPDFYGKSTYTFDVSVDTSGGRTPHMLVFYRANERRILDQLYKPETVRSILTELETLEPDDKLFFNDRWNDLVNGVTDSDDSFKEYIIGGFRFPIPDNEKYSIPRISVSTPAIYPFDGVTLPGTITDIIQQAIEGGFLPLTEQPVLFDYLQTGKQTSGRTPRIRNNDGQLLHPTDPDFDPVPMAVKYAEDGETYVRFTDYTLDGAAKNFYFYFGTELSNQLKVSQRSAISGPILLVNTSPTEDPTIKKVTSQLANAALSLPTAVRFEINNYIPAEGIKKLEIYRVNNPSDALSVRTMSLAKVVNIGDEVTDDFSDVSFPLYGDPLFYRIVALREITNENEEIEYVPSKASNVVLTNVVDTQNPAAPILRSINGNATSTELEDVILKWNSTCYNGTYALQKLNESGNWVEIYKVKSNDETLQYPPLDSSESPDFTNFLATELLPRQDGDGNNIYHRFRVQVENSSGLFNLNNFELTLAKGTADLQELPSYLSYEDANGHEMVILENLDIITGASEPDSITFTHKEEPLPAGHNTFVKIEIILTDDLANTFTKTILVSGGSVTFNHGDGGLILDNSSPNRLYTIRTKMFTDYATEGATQVFRVNYLAGPYYDLSQISAMVSLTDSTHNINPFNGGNVNDGLAYPGFLTFTDISNLSGIGQVLDSIEITVSDDLGNSFTKTISSAAGSVTFDQGDGDLELDATQPNRSYTVDVKVKTDLCTTGTSFSYESTYVFSPCDQLASLTTVASFVDENSHSIDPLVSQNILLFSDPDGSITITEIVSSELPLGHTFTSMDVYLEDDLSGQMQKTIAAANGNVVFTNGEGGLILDSSNPERTYSLTLILYTDLCSIGSVYAYQVKYGA